MRIPKHARKELEAYLDCGLLCCGLARLRCQGCGESRLVAFSCKGRGFCGITFSFPSSPWLKPLRRGGAGQPIRGAAKCEWEAGGVGGALERP